MADRDRYRPRIPPASIRAQTARPLDDVDDDEIEHTPVHGTPLERIEWRQRRTSIQLQHLTERVDRLVDEGVEERKAREERAELLRVEQAAARERAAEREHQRLADERNNRKLIVLAIVGIVVPTLAAVGAWFK
jgi:hypothetical protein